MNKTYIKQTPSNPDNWLYHDISKNDRYFTKSTYTNDAEDLWPECTNDEKMAWEEAHKPIIVTE